MSANTTKTRIMPNREMGKGTLKMENSRPKLLEPEVIETILLDRSNRLQELIDEGRFDDAVSIGEEFDEW